VRKDALWDYYAAFIRPAAMEGFMRHMRLPFWAGLMREADKCCCRRGRLQKEAGPGVQGKGEVICWRGQAVRGRRSYALTGGKGGELRRLGHLSEGVMRGEKGLPQG